MASKPKGLGLVEGIDEAKANTLYGDIRDLMLQEIRDNQGKPWDQRGETEQWDVIQRIDKFATNLVIKACALVAEGDSPSIRVLVDSFTVKKGLKIVLTASTTPEALDALSDGKGAFLVFADPEQFKGARAAVGPAADQPDLLDDPDEDADAEGDLEPDLDGGADEMEPA